MLPLLHCNWSLGDSIVQRFRFMGRRLSPILYLSTALNCSGGLHPRGFPVHSLLWWYTRAAFDITIKPVTHYCHILHMVELLWRTHYCSHTICIRPYNWRYISFGDIAARKHCQSQFITYLLCDVVAVPVVNCQLILHIETWT